MGANQSETDDCGADNVVAWDRRHSSIRINDCSSERCSKLAALVLSAGTFSLRKYQPSERRRSSARTPDAAARDPRARAEEGTEMFDQDQFYS